MLSAFSSPKRLVFVDVALLLLSLICSVSILSWGIFYCRYGLDLTDEGYYLHWITNPFSYRASVTQFGFIYHPLSLYFGGDIAAIRQANLLITFGMAWAVSSLCIQHYYGKGGVSYLHRQVCATAFATGSIVWIGGQSPTPSYNSLAFQALLAASLGLLLCEKSASLKSLVGWVLVGIGGWLAFMAKPTTAIALGVGISIYLWLARKVDIRLLLVSIVTVAAALALSATIMDGSLPAFADRVANGFDQAKKLGVIKSPTQYLRLDLVYPRAEGSIPLVLAAMGIYAIIYFNRSTDGLPLIVGRVLSTLVAVTTCAILYEIYDAPLFMGPYRRLLLLCLPLTTFYLACTLCGLKSLGKIGRRGAAMGVIFTIFPYIYAFGTGNNYWYSGAAVGFFWIVASLVYLIPFAAERYFKALLLCLGLLVQLIVASLIQSGFQQPYRQPLPLRKNQYGIEIGGTGSTLLISQRVGQYLSEARSVAKSAHFNVGTPMLDLSGQSPGLLFVIGAKSVGQAWIIGGYPGSNQYAIESLKFVPCEDLVTAWILTATNGARAISPSVLNSFGANIDTDYSLVGVLNSIKDSARASDYSEQHLMLRPVRKPDVARTSCETSRQPTK